MNIVFFETEQWEKDYLDKSDLKDCEVRSFSDRLDKDTASLAENAEIISVFIYSEVDKPVLDLLPNLQMIATRSTGFDHIDLDECKRRNIEVANVPAYGENTVAEHAFGLILSLSRKIYKAVMRTSRLDFSFQGLRGFDLMGKTIGVVGAGRIGLHVVRIAKGFGMNVVVYDLRQEQILAEVLGFTYIPLDDLLAQSDVITLHVPLNKATTHLINSDNISQIKRGAILINTARGAVVETEAIVSALDSGILSGVGLDVFEGEETVKEESSLLVRSLPSEKMREILLSYSLLHRDNVVITPHIAFYSDEALQRIMNTTVDNILNFMEGSRINQIAA
jgi:D-lactate dehydrogenase